MYKLQDKEDYTTLVLNTKTYVVPKSLENRTHKAHKNDRVVQSNSQ